MNTPKSIWQQVYKSHRGISILICKVLVVGMMGCLSFGYAQFIRRIAFEAGSSFYPIYLIFFSLLVSSEALYTQRRANDLDGRDKWIFRSAELLTIAILLKVFILLRLGVPALLAEVTQWRIDFLSAFFSIEFFSGLILLGIVWMFSTFLSSDIDDLHDREQDAMWDELGKVQNALHAIRSRIMSYIFVLGFLILVFAVGARLNFRFDIPFLKARFDPSITVINVLLFFVLTLVLMSQTQFALLRTRWLWDKTPVAPSMARRWLLYGLVFFSALAVLSFLLPTGYSLPLFQTLGYMLNAIMAAFQFLMALLVFLISPCASLFNLSEATEAQEIPPQPTPYPPAVSPDSPSSLWQIIQSVLFWTTLIAVVIFALSQYIRSNSYMFRRLARLPILKWINNILKAVWNWLKGAKNVVSAAVKSGLRLLRPPANVSRTIERILRRPGGRTAKEQVMELFLTLVELGKRAGPARTVSETPHQYSQDIIRVHPDVSQEVVDITEAFNEARYSDHPVNTDTLPTLREKWERIRGDYDKNDQP